MSFAPFVRRRAQEPWTSSLATDRSGFLWMGTENGVYRFLGYGFERYGAEQGLLNLMSGT